MSDQKIAVQVMPNPYLDKLNVNFTSDVSGKAEIRMMSVSGTVVKKTQSTINKGSTYLATGIYLPSFRECMW